MYSDTDLNSFDSFSNLLQRVCILPDGRFGETVVM